MDIEKRKSPPTDSLGDLQTVIRQVEELLGPLVAIDNDDANTILSFDQDQETPATAVELEAGNGQTSVRAGLDELVASGTAIVAGNKMVVAAFRAVFRSVDSTSNKIPPVGRALLDTIAGTESPGYNVIYGGQTFDDFSHHPDIAVPIRTGPNRGRTSTAAGRYQFIFSTWRELQQELNLPDFSPASQDLAAWFLAQTTYKNKVGTNLQNDLENGILDNVGPALHSQWTSLPGGIEQGVNSNRFERNYKLNLAKYETPASGGPTQVA